MLKVNSGEKPERRRSVVSFAEETTIIGTSDGSDEAREEEPEKQGENKTGEFVLPSLNCKSKRTTCRCATGPKMDR